MHCRYMSTVERLETLISELNESPGSLLRVLPIQARIRTAVRARTARRDYEVLFKGMKAKQLAGQVSVQSQQTKTKFVC